MSQLFQESTQNLLKQDHPELFLVQDVNRDLYVRVMESLTFLRSRGSPPLKIIIDSPGGEVAPGLDIYDAIRLYPGNTEAVVHREAASMGAVILQACKVRTCAKHATVLIHYVARSQVSLSELRSRKQLKELVENLEIRQRRLDAIFAERTKKTVARIRSVCRKDKPMTSEEALAFGLIDKII